MPRVRAEIDPDVMVMVEEALAADPDTPVPELHERASAMSDEVAALTTRQFHARYPLQVKRRMNRESGSDADDAGTKATPTSKARSGSSSPRAASTSKGGSPSRKRAGASRPRATSSNDRSSPRTSPSRSASSREGVRRILMEFASDLEHAEERKELVRLLADIDRYVDRLMDAASG